MNKRKSIGKRGLTHSGSTMLLCPRPLKHVHKYFLSVEKLLRLNDSQKVLVHSGIVCARIHALKGTNARVEKVCEIEQKVYGMRPEKFTNLVSTRISRRVKLSVGEIRVLFNHIDQLPHTTFMLSR